MSHWAPSLRAARPGGGSSAGSLDGLCTDPGGSEVPGRSLAPPRPRPARRAPARAHLVLSRCGRGSGRPGPPGSGRRARAAPPCVVRATSFLLRELLRPRDDSTAPEQTQIPVSSCLPRRNESELRADSLPSKRLPHEQEFSQICSWSKGPSREGAERQGGRLLPRSQACEAERPGSQEAMPHSWAAGTGRGPRAPGGHRAAELVTEHPWVWGTGLLQRGGGEHRGSVCGRERGARRLELKPRLAVWALSRTACVCMCARACECVCAHVCLCTCTCALMGTHKCVCMGCMCAHAHVCALRVHVCAARAHTCACVYVCICAGLDDHMTRGLK